LLLPPFLLAFCFAAAGLGFCLPFLRFLAAAGMFLPANESEAKSAQAQAIGAQ
jgi:hypothetical protein